MPRAQGNWSVESAEADKGLQLPGPGKAAMAGLLPSLPSTWEKWKVDATDSQVFFRIGHLAPNPANSMKAFYDGMKSMAEMNLLPNFSVQKINEMREQSNTLRPERFDVVCMFSIAAHVNKKLAKEAVENLYNPMKALIGSIPEGMDPFEMLKESAGEEVAAKITDAFKAGDAATKAIKSKKGRFLGEEALLIEMKGTETPSAVLIGRFIVMGDILSLAVFADSGDKKCDKIGGKQLSNGSTEQSTLRREGYIHREEMQDMAKQLFAKVKELAAKDNELENAGATGIVGGTVKSGNSIMVLADGKGNKITLGSGSELRINNPTSFVLPLGSASWEIGNIGSKEQITVKTSLASISFGKGFYAVSAISNQNSLTVMKGDAEFACPKGKIKVAGNQACSFGAEQGLYGPMPLPKSVLEYCDKAMKGKKK